MRRPSSPSRAGSYAGKNPGGFNGRDRHPSDRARVMFDELERFVTAHRRCGELNADPKFPIEGEPTETGYGLQVACSCGAVFERYVTPEMADHDVLRARLLAFPG